MKARLSLVIIVIIFSLNLFLLIRLEYYFDVNQHWLKRSNEDQVALDKMLDETSNKLEFDESRKIKLLSEALSVENIRLVEVNHSSAILIRCIATMSLICLLLLLILILQFQGKRLSGNGA